MQRRTGLNPVVKFILIFGFVALAFWLFMKYKDVILPKGRETKSILSDELQKDVKAGTVPLLNVCIVDYPGYAPAIGFNNGYNENKESRFYTEYGILVKFTVINDVPAARVAWQNDKVDVVASTQDMYPLDASGLLADQPRAVWTSSKSRGADVFIATHEIRSIRDLIGKKVALCEGSPSHSFFMIMLQADQIEYDQIQVVKVNSAPDAAAYFINGQVDAAVVWSPDDLNCLNSVKGAHILKSTEQVTEAIVDMFFAKESFIEKNRSAIQKLYDGWMTANAECNSNPAIRDKAAGFLAAGMQMSKDDALFMMSKVRFCTHGDNVNFFNLNPNYSGMTGQEIYGKMTRLYMNINLAPDNVPAWRTVANSTLVQNSKLTGALNAAEGGIAFSAPGTTETKAEAFARKTLSVTFKFGSAELDQNGKTIIEIGFADVARQFAGSRVRLVGHTDNVGSNEANMTLSRRRAEAVKNYLVQKYSFDANRFITQGKGSTVPVASNDSEDGREKNRRVDFEILN
jgi:NitT/TauT family transport system substrate-binding protein